MRTKKITIGLTLTIVLYALLVSFTYNPKTEYVAIQQKKWIAPASADSKINPLKGDAKSIASGKRMFKMVCAVCHGVKGKGDGVGGAGLNPKPANLTSEAVQSQSDGAIYWKIEQGRGSMPNYKTSLKEKNKWQIINYLRTLKK